MFSKTILGAVHGAIAILFLVTPASILACDETQIQVRVIDQNGQPIEGATIDARYLRTVKQEGRVYKFPFELSKLGTVETDENGLAKLTLEDVDWELAGLHAFRRILTSDEEMELYDRLPKNELRRKALEEAISKRARQAYNAYKILSPDSDFEKLITLKMERPIEVSGRILIDEQPLRKGYVMIRSPQTKIDKLFPRWSPWLTDKEGRFSFFTVPRELSHARIEDESGGKERFVELKNVSATRTSKGAVVDFDLKSEDFESSQKPVRASGDEP